jgi:subtilisin family serine protease
VGSALAAPAAFAHELAKVHLHSLLSELPTNKSVGPLSVSRAQLTNNTRYYPGSILAYQIAPPMTVVPPPKKKIVPPRRNDFVKDELLLTYDFGMDIDAVKAITKKYNLIRKGGIAIKSVRKSVVIADTQGQNPLDLQDLINKSQKSFQAMTNNFYTPAATRHLKLDYPLAQTGIDRARTISRGKGILIGMVDTPVDLSHSALRGSNIEQRSIVDPKTVESKVHGTSIAGVLVSKHPQIGVAPDAKLLSVSAFSSRPGHPNALRGKSTDIVKAIAYCIERNVDILNLSFTGGKDSFVETIVKEAVRRGITVVAAGGNRGRTNSTVYPAVIDGVVGVTAVDRMQRRYKNADMGRFIDIAAPGVGILTLAPQGRYQKSTGTSMAAAHLSGVMALLKEYRRNYKSHQLNQTAIDLGRRGKDIEFGNGLVNASAALRQLGAPLPF